MKPEDQKALLTQIQFIIQQIASPGQNSQSILNALATMINIIIKNIK